MMHHKYLSLLCGTLLAIGAGAEPVSEAALGGSVERHLSSDEAITQWTHDPQRINTEAGDMIVQTQVTKEELETVKLQNVIPPIRFESGVADIPPGYIEALRKVLDGMQERRNVRLHLVGHADDQPLSEALARVYGDNAGLSRERAGEVAEYLQGRLNLRPEAISYEWAGDTQPIATNATAEGRALNRRVEVEVWYDEIRERAAQEDVLLKENFRRLKVCRMETVCKMRFMEGHSRRARIKNLVPPLHFKDETTEVSEAFVEHIRKGLHNLQGKQNVMVKFIGYTDDLPLVGRDERIYGTHVALSKARAHRVALAIQERLLLPTAAVSSDGRGATLPLASNETDQGRALNRRIEVEFWHDDPLQEMPDEPQMCPNDGGDEIVTKVYEPSWGRIEPLQLDAGRAAIPAGYTAQLRRAMNDIADKTNVRLRFIGYTRNERLDRRAASVYGDDIGLSAARARRAMDTIREQMQLTEAQAEHEGRGFVHSSDVVNFGFTQGETSHIVVQVVYDEPAVVDDYEGVDITKLTRELSPKNPFGLNLMRITVDGEPIDDKNRSSADIQRCTDVALERADIQFQFDNLQSSRRLSVAASPKTVVLHDFVRSAQPSENDASLDGSDAEQIAADSEPTDDAEPFDFAAAESIPDDTGLVTDETDADLDEATEASAERTPRFIGAPVRFRMYANYSAFLDRAEVRIFAADQSLQATPVAITSIDSNGFAEWQPTSDQVEAPLRELKYVLRAYDKSGNFDETAPQSLWLVYGNEAGTEPDAEKAKQGDEELLAGYGESALSVSNIRLGSGTVKVRGSGIPAAHTVWVAGKQVPVDRSGNFVAEEVLPSGLHTVEVAVLDETGSGSLYLRDLEFERNDWFYVGLADLTVSENRTSGPADLLQGENAPYDYDSSFDGRLAFYVNGKFGEHWGLTASADTREGPVEDLFSNFLDKTPESLFRRIDPDYHYPTFGDDSIVEDVAPTLGKFYVKVNRDQNHALWGNFKINYLGNELAHVDRGLYGGNLHFQSEETTSFGEQRLALDGFAAEPGTLASREEFRGTGGSLYFLRNQDILVGSERVRIELRDKDSGLVTGVQNLRPVLDYDIDYLQGRILLTEPLNSTADDNLLIRSSGLSGDEAHLVVRYEYTPGFSDIDALATGGQGHYWINDHVKVGLTASTSEEGDSESSLNGADVTLRMSSESWLKVQGAKSEGLVSSALYSDDGGFGFVSDGATTFDEASADAYRADLSVGFEDLIDAIPGRITLYTQTLGEGYSAPGLTTLTDTTHHGGTLRVQMTEQLQVRAKADKKTQEQGYSIDAQEFNVGYQVSDRWNLSTGVRKDAREYDGAIVPASLQQGERTDGVLQVGFDSRSTWRAYGFAQDTLSRSAEREANGRVGLGGSYRFTERFRADVEVSDGDLGPGGKVGTNFLYSERTSLYLNYALENERTDNGLQGRRGNLISGMKRRLSDSSSMYVEERYQDTDSASGLTHSTGMTLAPNDRWNFGTNTDIGTLVDSRTGTKIDREAGGVRVGYGFDSVQFSSAVEYRLDKTQQPDQTLAERTTWLYRNSFKYQLTPSWRLLGKFNHADSSSSLGQFYDGGYTEAVMGYGFRPVEHDRLNALAKYTYFYNVPTTEQVTPQYVAAQFIQKSHIGALDVTYDLTDRWSVGGKYAYRLGQVSLDRESRQFFDNCAQLYILRTDLTFAQHWAGLIEGRMLDMTDLNEQRTGALVALYRYVGNHVKVGVGYNFTDFSEDLTDLSFEHQGAFLNIIGAM
ncbi:MAG TPA: OmpA family protein [Steroidobacter sp.]|uniref:OmpA family protein n=1 Tax=Steroidobacter sp. TaxID=1978227 RepID=UPI002EDAAF3F